MSHMLKQSRLWAAVRRRRSTEVDVRNDLATIEIPSLWGQLTCLCAIASKEARVDNLERGMVRPKETCLSRNMTGSPFVPEPLGTEESRRWGCDMGQWLACPLIVAVNEDTRYAVHLPSRGLP
jgi:hypothetical protein